MNELEITDCSALNAGALFVDNVRNLIITNSLFKGNSAESSDSEDESLQHYSGGAIIYSCSGIFMPSFFNVLDEDCVLKFEGETEISDNYAETMGGGIQWLQIPPIFESTPLMLNNQVTVKRFLLNLLTRLGFLEMISHPFQNL